MALIALLLLLCIAAIAVGIGARVLRRLGLEAAPAAERFCFALAIGLGGIAYGVFLLGLLHLLWLPPVLALLLGLALLGARPGLALARDVWQTIRSGSTGGGGLALLTGGAVILLLLLALIAALAPPSGGDWDGLSYHLADPAIYLRHRGIVNLFWESHSNFPFTLEMLYALGLLLKNPGAARAFHWLFLVLTCLTLAGAWRRLWPEAPANARWLAPLLLVTAPVVLWSGTVAYNDLALMGYELLAFYGVWLWARTGRAGWLWAGALCLGFALGTKMTALLPAALLTPAILVVGRRAKAGTAAALRRLLAWGSIAAAVGAPWYLKSYLFTKNPVYPFFYNLFPHTRYWSAENAAMYAGEQVGFGIGHTWRHLLMVPWDLLAHAERFTNGQPSFAILFGSLGPVFLALAPAVLLLRRRDRIAEGLLLLAAAFGLLWFKMSEQTRYLMPVLPLLALVGARGLCGLAAERRLARFAGIGVVLLQAAVALITGLLMALPALPVVAGQEAPGDYLRRTLNVYPICEYANVALPREARVLLIHETRGFYLERDYLWGNPGHHTAIPWTRFRDEAQMRQFLREKLGITHVLVNHNIAPREMQPTGWDRALWDAIHAGTLTPVYEEKGFCLYAIGDGI